MTCREAESLNSRKLKARRLHDTFSSLVPHSAQSAPLPSQVVHGPGRIISRKGTKALRGDTERRPEHRVGKMSLTWEGFLDINRPSLLREFLAHSARGLFYVFRALVTGRGPRAGAGLCNSHYRVSRID